MIIGKNFIFTGLQAWDIAIGSNARDMALEISKHNRVLYVNTPLDYITAKKTTTSADLQQRLKVLRGLADPIRQINENLWVVDCPFTILPANALPDGFLFDAVNKLNNKKIFKFVRQTCKALKFENAIHIIDNDMFRSFYAKEYLPSAMTIYYRRDNLLASDFWSRHGLRLEPQLIKKCDLVLCNSHYLAQVAAQYNPHTFDIGQGVDLSAYHHDKVAIPADLEAIPRPTIGYIGNITSWRLDANLIEKLARQNSDYSFVLVGNADDVFKQHKLNELKNVYFLGSKPQNQVPSYISGFDICINPQIVNDATIGNYPRKVDEYLAFGKPTISTHTQTMEHLFMDHVYVCKEMSDYQQAIDKIASGESDKQREERIQFAHTHTWEASIESLYEAIKTLTNKK